MGDLGEYTCVVSNDQGEQQSASAYLNVQCKSWNLSKKIIEAFKHIILAYGIILPHYKKYLKIHSGNFWNV